MKAKNLFKRIGGMLVAFAFIFTACEDDIVTSELNLNDAHKGTLKVYLNAELNLQEPGTEGVPDSTIVVLTGNNNSLHSNASGSWTREVASVDGVVEVTDVPVANGGSNITIYFPEFFYDQIQHHNAPEPTITKRYWQNQTTQYVLPNQVTTLTSTYNISDDYVVPTKEVSVTIELEHYRRYEEFTWNYIQEIPLNGTVTLFRDWGGSDTHWSKEVSVTDGILETTVPADNDFNIEYETTIQHGDYETPGDDGTTWVTEETIDYVLELNVNGFDENQPPSHYERTYNANNWSYYQWQ
ncbi:MAG: hypothetical protein ACLFNU_13190 [Bacteroidales bacterium]